jgi:prepilin-type N-terminal cleavage/methylation domain-containing protein
MASPASSRLTFRLYQYLNSRRLASRQRSQRGFTLTELLVSIIIAAVIVAGLLYLVVEMLRVDQNEAVLNQTQQDMNNALEYITRDVQEAVFVYPTQGDLDYIVNQLSDEPAGADVLPIMAFWRVDPVDPASLASLLNTFNNCTTGTAAQREKCTVVSLRQSTYTLVVYFTKLNAANEIWEGEARIIRYQLPQYSNLATLTERAGYADPVNTGFQQPTLATGSKGWRAASATTDGSSAVLVDSLDSPTNNSPAVIGTGFPQCTDLSARHQRIPATQTVSTSFFTCIRDVDLTEAERGRLEIELDEEDAARNNQDLAVYIRGNATANRDGLFSTINENSRLPTLESRILVRGILDKRPQ